VPPFRRAPRQIELRPTVEVIEVTADNRGFLHSDAIVAHQVWDRPDGLTP
jgi:hypothetical protein